MYFTEKTVHDNGEKEFALVGMTLLITFISHVREPGITSYLTPDSTEVSTYSPVYTNEIRKFSST